MDQWAVCLRDRLPAYISWEQYEQNLRQLELNLSVARGVARKGSTLVAGLLKCGRCGHRMGVQYSTGNPRYACVHDSAVTAPGSRRRIANAGSWFSMLISPTPTPDRHRDGHGGEAVAGCDPPGATGEPGVMAIASRRL